METHSSKNIEKPGGQLLNQELAGLKNVKVRKDSETGNILLQCKDAEATEAVGTLIGKLSENGDVYCLSGDLGAGKTLLSQGISVAVGVPREEVVSPTFSLMNIYQGDKLEVRHFDLYRLNALEELADIGFYEYVGGDGITLIEWAELFTSEMPPEHLQVMLSIVPEGRVIELIPLGERYKKICKEVLINVNSGY